LGIVQFNLQSEIKESNALIEVGTLPNGLIASKSGMLQLFQNLIANAIKFRGDNQPHIYISTQQENTKWKFTIADNGIGLEEQYANKVFLPFQRLEKNTLPGSGIGLAICKKIVKLHHGTIWYKSKPGKGTCFYFTISQEKLELC
jgi:light-regulated signal transduction histidine kinase (bacteriophytochrome)